MRPTTGSAAAAWRSTPSSSVGGSVPSDRLLISGTAPTLAPQSLAATAITLNDVNPVPGNGAFNPTGITVAGVNGASANAFRLAALNCGLGTTTGFCAATGDLLRPGFGPMGAIQKGFFLYPLLQDHGAAVADGLTGANSSEYRLYGLPGSELLTLPFAITGAQNIWLDTALDWLDRQDDLHRWWRRGQFVAGSAAGGGADLPVKAPRPGYVSSGGPGVWVKATGAWTDRTASFDLGTLVPAAGVLPAVDTSFKQNTYSVMGGYDAGGGGILTPSDALVLGISGGYVESTVKFNSIAANFKYTGPSVGLSATYLNNGWFADSLLKADFLRLKMDFPGLAVFGFAGTSVDATNLGWLGNFGYRFNWGKSYVEPVATLAYVRTRIDNFTALGMTTNFNSGESFRGALGARWGTVAYENETHVVDVSVQGKYWDEFSSNTGVVLTTAGPGLLLNDDNRQRGYGEVRGLIDVANKGTGFSAFVDGGAKFNNEFTTITAKGGVRYQW